MNKLTEFSENSIHKNFIVFVSLLNIFMDLYSVVISMKDSQFVFGPNLLDIGFIYAFKIEYLTHHFLSMLEEDIFKGLRLGRNQ